MKSNNQPVTREILEQTLEEGFKNFGEDLLKIFVTKDDLKDDLRDLENRMATKEDLKDLESRMATKDELAGLKEEVIKGNDRVIKELQIVREEQKAHFAAHERFDKRITRVEDHLDLPPFDTLKAQT